MSEDGEEESFVILGTSPTNLNSPFVTGNYGRSNEGLSSPNSVKSLNKNVFELDSVSKNRNQLVTDGPNTEALGQHYKTVTKKDNINFLVNGDKTNNSDSINMPLFSKMNSDVHTTPKSSLESYKRGTSIDGSRVNSGPAKEGSLAASFLMGDIHLDDLKANIHSQFPSLSSSSSVKAEEMIKLQSILAEYLELKDTLQKNNVSMRKHFTTLQKWQDEVRAQKEQQTKQLNEFNETIAKLRNENLELQKELEHKIEQININEQSIREENKEMTKILSDKTSQIQNMAVQIEKLEQQHLDSFEFIRQLRNENEEEKENKKAIEHEYVPILEHKRILKDLEEKLSETVAKNLELDEVKEKYSKEVKELKDSLLECQEQLKNAQIDINVLKSNDDEKTKYFESYEKERDEMRNEILILKTQVEIYSKDFEMERVARQNLAGEKEKILSDLRLLQRRNQELLENSRKYIETMESEKNSSVQSSSIVDKNTSNTHKDEQVYEPSSFICPICCKTYKLLNDLQTHVQECMDNN